MEREFKESCKKHDHVKQLMGREYDLIPKLGTLVSSLKLQYRYNGSLLFFFFFTPPTPVVVQMIYDVYYVLIT